ncbi:hypothetical protein D3C79_1083280 [compost metagenome]
MDIVLVCETASEAFVSDTSGCVVCCVCAGFEFTVPPLFDGVPDAHADNNSIKLIVAAKIISLLLTFPNMVDSPSL